MVLVEATGTGIPSLKCSGFRETSRFKKITFSVLFMSHFVYYEIIALSNAELILYSNRNDKTVSRRRKKRRLVLNKK